MLEGLSREEMNLLVSSLDETIAELEAKLKRAHVENRNVAAVQRELKDVRARRDQLLDDLARLPQGGQA
jgi:hypothetical protein